MRINKTKFKLPLNKIKKWNFKEMEGFLILDSYFFNEYGLYETRNLIQEFVKKNKKKSVTLFEEIKKGDITLNFTGLIAVTSWLGYTPDKIAHITLGYRDKIVMYKIYTEDGNNITITSKQPILTKNGYKNAEDLTKKDMLIGILGKAKKFKKSKYPKYEEINTIVDNINKYFNKDGLLMYKKIPSKYKHYLNILGIDSCKPLKKEDFLSIIDSENKKDITIGEFSETIINKKNIFERKIDKIEKIEMKDVYIGNITTNLGSNININNFILDQWT